jgi:hypothetical protein
MIAAFGCFPVPALGDLIGSPRALAVSLLLQALLGVVRWFDGVDC